MSALTAARTCSCCSGGKGRGADGPADDADGALELDPVGVDVCLGSSPADQGRYGLVGEQVPVYLLPDHVRALGPQYLPRPPQVGLELGVTGLMLPALVVGLGQHACRGLARVGDGGDQGEQLAGTVTVAVGDLVLDHPDAAGLVLVQLLPRVGSLDEPLPGLATDLRADQHRAVTTWCAIVRPGVMGDLGVSLSATYAAARNDLDVSSGWARAALSHRICTGI